MKYQFKISGRDFTVDVTAVNAGTAQVMVNGKHYDVIIEDNDPASRAISPAAPGHEIVQPQKPASVQGAPEPVSPGTDGAVLAPIPGLIVAVLVRVGDEVRAGQAVAIMEAMKMENELTAHQSGIVMDIPVQKGAEVKTGETIMRIA